MHVPSYTKKGAFCFFWGGIYAFFKMQILCKRYKAGLILLYIPLFS
jgi:hypothetical protein